MRYTIFLRCEACHAVLAPIREWHQAYGADWLYAAVAVQIEAHAVTCPCAPLRDHPTGEPRE